MLSVVTRAGVADREPGLRTTRLHVRLDTGELVVGDTIGAGLVELAIDVVLAGAERCQILEGSRRLKLVDSSAQAFIVAVARRQTYPRG